MTVLMTPSIDASEEYSTSTIPEERLFQSVVIQAIRDATSWIGDARSRYSIGEARRTAKAARDWLLGNSPDFNDVCCFAKMDPRAIRFHALRLKRQGWVILTDKPNSRSIQGGKFKGRPIPEIRAA